MEPFFHLFIFLSFENDLKVSRVEPWESLNTFLFFIFHQNYFIKSCHSLVWKKGTSIFLKPLATHLEIEMFHASSFPPKLSCAFWDSWTLYAGIPYSEHSSYLELKEFVQVWLYQLIVVFVAVWFGMVDTVSFSSVFTFLVLAAGEDHPHCQCWECCHSR